MWRALHADSKKDYDRSGIILKVHLCLAGLLLLSVRMYDFRPVDNLKYRDPIIYADVYEVAEMATGAPANILRAIAIVESNEKDSARGDGGKSLGRMQLNEKWRKYRVAKYGNYNPHIPQDSVMLSAIMFQEHLAILGSFEAAISAHNVGLDGVRRYGIQWEYVNKVKRATK